MYLNPSTTTSHKIYRFLHLLHIWLFSDVLGLYLLNLMETYVTVILPLLHCSLRTIEGLFIQPDSILSHKITTWNPILEGPFGQRSKFGREQ